jgi:hypothetical protein
MKNLQKGYLLVQVLVFAAAGVIVTGGLIGWAGTSLKLSRYLASREQAFQIAEAGVEYYRWHLAHAPTDFFDGNASSTGPYLHSYKDKDGKVIGQFALTITPPPIGSTMVTVTSEGQVFDGSSAKRTVESKMAIPSLAKYAVVANAKMRFGEGTEIFGPIHSNDGIRFDGVSHNLITSSQATYDDPDHSDHSLEYGVHTHDSPTDPLPPTALPSRSDVFIAGRQFPVPAVDFTGLTADLASLKTQANTASGRYFASSGSQGYHLVLKTNDTFDLYKVTSVYSAPHGCSDSASGWGTWSIRNESFVANYSFPANSIIFVEDNVWVSGQINTARLTIASGRFPESTNTNTSITVNSDLKYTNYDGQDVIGLIAQNNFNVGLYSENDLQIDGALIAKNGRVGRYYYGSSCGSEYKRSKLTLFGMIATSQRYGFAYVDDTGYDIRNITYDGSLLYGPPPSFPLTSDQYQIISWREK